MNAQPRAAGPIRVMTVDDHPVFRTAAADIVAAMPGFESVGESEDAQAALEQVAAADPDIVIVDVRMPGMDGFELAGRLAEQDPEPGHRARLQHGRPRLLAPGQLDLGAAAMVSKHWLTPRMLRGLWLVHRRR